uniref:Solute carrier family 25 member 32 n=1 Tax=Phallusia mammillata TaxID=59560 RepID=A0A6F9DSS8_9ASCI|nr:mitochondrial folate transporter/carrier [Phallusia mammillata]
MNSTFNYKHFVAGVAGGVTATSILHPLDLIKIRFSVSDGLSSRPQYNSMWDLTKSVWKKQGFRGLYAGVTPNIIGAGMSWGLYFFLYQTIKNQLNRGDASKPLTAFQYLACGIVSGSITLLITNPVWIAKTRLCLQYESQTKIYRGTFHTISSLYKQNGIRGLYKGLVPGLLGTSHGAVQFFVYERLKIWNANRRNVDVGAKMRTADIIAMSAISKITAATSTYPYQVIRARLQEQHRAYKGIWDVIISTWRNEGWKGFYKGLGANLLRVTPACCITFFTYELLMENLPEISTAKT